MVIRAFGEGFCWLGSNDEEREMAVPPPQPQGRGIMWRRLALSSSLEDRRGCGAHAAQVFGGEAGIISSAPVVRLGGKPTKGRGVSNCWGLNQAPGKFGIDRHT
jgi:hypothetical protein